MGKILIIGLDGASWSFVRQGMEEGQLPHFSHLRREGSWGKLQTVPNLRSPCAWTSFMTGTNPGKHGIYEFYERIPGTYKVRFTTGSDRKGKAFWEILSEVGKKGIIINVPMTYPAKPINGIIIAGLDSPGIESEGFAYPIGILREIVKAVGDYVLEPGVTGLVMGGKEELAIKKVFYALEKRAEATKYLMRKYPWDCLVVVFRALDPVQHCFWKYMGSRSHQFSRVIMDTYAKIDEIVGNLLDEVEEDTTVIVVSDHGFGHRQWGNNCLNNWLEKLGLLHFRETSSPILSPDSILKRSYREVERHLPRKAKEMLVRLFPHLREDIQSRLLFSRIDWGRTKAFADDLMPAIWINVKGEMPRGRVEPGREYRDLVNFIKERLKETYDPESGERVVEEVHHREEIYWGPYISRAPDILIQWRGRVHIQALATRGYGVAKPYFPTQESQRISGDHREDAILFLKGKEIKKGKAIEGGIVDIAPTLLYLLGVPLPKEMDGKVLVEAIEEGFLHSRPCQFHDYREDIEEGPPSFTPDELEKIRDRLKGLGYID